MNDNVWLFAAELKMDVLREREIKESVERQLANEQKRRSKYPLRVLFSLRLLFITGR